MQLSKHFSLEEFTTSDQAARHGINNTPMSDDLIENLKMTASTLELIRELVGKPVFVSSGYRCLALNRLIGSKDNSAHVQGLAADIKVDGLTPRDLAHKIIAAKIPLDQIIYEGNWIHIGLSLEVLRQQQLTATFVNGKASYTVGIA